jgi:hypothetical protein
MSNYSCKTRGMRTLAVVPLFVFALLLTAPFDAKGFQGQEEAEAARKAAEEAAARARAEAAAAEQMRRDQQRSQDLMRDFLKDSREIIDAANQQRERQAEILRRAEYVKVNEAFRVFEDEREKFAETISSPKVSRDALKKIEKTTGAFLDLIKRHTKHRGKLDAKEFKDYTAQELRWEMLTTAELLSPHLEALLRSENEETVDLNYLMSLSKTEAQLLRLQWMTRKVK